MRKPTVVECLRGKKIIHVAVGALHCLAVGDTGQVSGLSFIVLSGNSKLSSSGVRLGRQRPRAAGQRHHGRQPQAGPRPRHRGGHPDLARRLRIIALCRMVRALRSTILLRNSGSKFVKFLTGRPSTRPLPTAMSPSSSPPPRTASARASSETTLAWNRPARLELQVDSPTEYCFIN